MTGRPSDYSPSIEMCLPEIDNAYAVAALRALTLGTYPRGSKHACDIGDEMYLYTMHAQNHITVLGQVSGLLILSVVIASFAKRLIGIIQCGEAARNAKLRKFACSFVIVASICLSGAPHSAYAEEASDRNYSVDDLVTRVSKATQIDRSVIDALATHESNKHPWTLAIGRKPYSFSSREEAEQRLLQTLRIGEVNVDVGLFQVSYRWNWKLVLYPRDLLDPRTNAAASVNVLSGCKKTHNDIRSILSCYNSGNVDEKGLAYADSVLSKTGYKTVPTKVAVGGDSAPRKRRMLYHVERS